MSAAFAGGPRREPVTQATIQKMLDENTQLIQAILEYQNQGKARECTQYQQILHRNLIYLATLADSNLNLQSQLNTSNAAGGMSMAAGPGSSSAPSMQGTANAMAMARSQMLPSMNQSGPNMNQPSVIMNQPGNMNQPGSNMPPSVNDMSSNQQSLAPNITVSGPGELPSHMLNQSRQGIPDMSQFNSGPPVQQNPGF